MLARASTGAPNVSRMGATTATTPTGARGA